MHAIAATPARVPLSFWIVAVASLSWNAFGGYDFTMTNLRDPAYLAHFPPGMIGYLDGFPAWTLAAWALGVWGAVAGSVLLLARSRFAVIAFALSLAGLALSTVYQFVLSDPPPEMTSAPMLAMTALIWAAAIFLLWYALRARRQGVLR